MVIVTFVNAGTGAVIGRTQLPPERLPEAFEVSTTLDLVGTQYVVVRAEPPYAAEFRATGNLTLFLEAVELVSPRDIRFSLPTICDRLPVTDPGLDPANRLELHEDDWRQIEYVDASLGGVVAAQRSGIRALVAEHACLDDAGRVVGYAEIYVREEPVDPLPRGIPMSLLLDALRPEVRYSGVGFRGEPGRVPDSFAFRGADSVVYYGIAVGDRAKVLGLSVFPPSGGFVPISDDVVLVNWLET